MRAALTNKPLFSILGMLLRFVMRGISLRTDLGMVYLKSWGMRKIGLGGLYVKLSAHVLGVSQT